MTKVISTINLKGGVGKTQMTVALAEFLALENRKKVLLIDLDPQTNATVSLIRDTEWEKKDQEGKTLKQLFKDKLERTSEFNITEAIIKRVSNVGRGIRNLDLLPSSLGLIEIQDSLPLMSAGRFFVASPVTILKEALSEVIDDYDLVLVDCPPNLGIITLNGIFISDYYVIPAIPDILSTYGIPQIISRVIRFQEESKQELEPMGIVISMYRAQSRLHRSKIQELKSRSKLSEDDDLWVPRIFDTVIPLTVRVAEAADVTARVNTLKQKYGYGTVYDTYKSLTREFLKYVGQ